MKKLERVCVVGAGAIGSLLIGHLGTVVETVVLTRREDHARALNEQGLRVKGKSDLHARVTAKVRALCHLTHDFARFEGFTHFTVGDKTG